MVSGATKQYRTYDEYSKIAMDNQDVLCYIADMETYELLYVNKGIQDLLSINTTEQYQGKMCYELLQGKNQPCEFCTNSKLVQGEVYNWEYYNPVLKGNYSLDDTMIYIDGRRARLEIAKNIDDHCAKLCDLQARLSTERTLVRCVQTLVEHTSTNAAIDSLLSIVGEYYDSDRAYIFEFNYKSATMDNTYEWCANEITPEIDNLQGVPLEGFKRWTDAFDKGEGLFIGSVDELDKDSDEYKVLAPQGIERMMAYPLIMGGKVTGFLGVDNPAQFDQEVELLRSAAIFVMDDLRKRRMNHELEKLSYVDALTGLHNRNRYVQTLRELDETPPEMLGVVYADINGLKSANDSRGHDYGDHLIFRAAQILRKIMGSAYRVGGDEFVVLRTDLGKQEFDALVDTLREAIDADEQCNMSIGIIWKANPKNVIKEITNSDKLMYAEKQNYYKAILPTQRNYRSDMVQTLLGEISRGVFEIFLQAKVELKTGRIMGAEALVRKRGENGHMVPPDRFIPLYEMEGIIRHLDFYVLEQVCKTLHSWIEAGYPIAISVNISRATFFEHKVVDEIFAICEKYGVDPKWIEIEITESHNALNYDELGKKLGNLKERGFSVSLDDFGSQYANLQMLASANFTQVKLDKSLVEQLCDNQKNRVVVEHAIQMCKQLDSTHSLAEGIETAEQLEMLMELECSYGQGYLFLKPLPINDFLEVYLAQREEMGIQ